MMVWLFCVAGGVLILGSALQASRLNSVRRWPSCTGRITRSDYEIVGGEYLIRVAYRFEVGGQSFEGDRLDLARPAPVDLAACQDWMTRHPVGSPVQVFYRAKDPTDNALARRLDPSAAKGIGMLLAAGLVLLVGGGVLTRV